jgi:hypothetical protein
MIDGADDEEDKVIPLLKIVYLLIILYKQKKIYIYNIRDFKYFTHTCR